MKAGRFGTTLLWAAAIVALAVGFVAYRQPALMVDLANQLWNCF
jgi:hypothetical protein